MPIYQISMPSIATPTHCFWVYSYWILNVWVSLLRAWIFGIWAIELNPPYSPFMCKMARLIRLDHFSFGRFLIRALIGQSLNWSTPIGPGQWLKIFKAKCALRLAERRLRLEENVYGPNINLINIISIYYGSELKFWCSDIQNF